MKLSGIVTHVWLKHLISARVLVLAELLLGGVASIAHAGGDSIYLVKAPEKVAVITSSGVNGDHQSVNEYDETLKKLGWKFDKYMNPGLKTVLDGTHGRYDLILGTSLWNYGDPQNMIPLVPRIRDYLKNGGIMILTDSNYNPMVDWFRALDPELFVEFKNIAELGDKSVPDFTSRSPILNSPNKIMAGFSEWAYFSKWGKKYTPMVRMRDENSALMLGASVGRGVLIVTTCIRLTPEILQNAYTAATEVKDGFEICPVFGEVPRWPGEWNAELRIQNTSSTRQKFQIGGTLSSEKLRKILPMKEITVGPRSKALLKFPLRVFARGPSRIELTANHQLIAVRNIIVPPMLSLKFNRPILAMNDDLIVSTKVLLPELEIKSAKLRIALSKASQVVPLFDGPAQREKQIRIPASKLGVGQWQLKAVATYEGNQNEQSYEIEVRAMASPPTKVDFGKQGELLVNGQAMFPLGVYHCSPADAKKMGFNCVTGPIFPCKMTSLDPGLRKWFDDADSLGIKVLQEYSDYVRAPEFKPENLRQMASELRLHPATLILYAIDEPGNQGISPQSISSVGDLLKECDPEHPVLVCDLPHVIARYAPCGDVLAIDPYPIGEGVCDNLSAGMTDYLDATVKVGKGRPVWVVIQTHRLPPATSKNRYPMPDEVRCMAYLALNHGAKGLLFYAFDDTYDLNGKPWPSGFKYDTALMQSIPALQAELSKIGPAYVAGKVIRLSSPKEVSDLDIVKIEYHGKATRVVINPTCKPLTMNGETIHPFEVRITELK